MWGSRPPMAAVASLGYCARPQGSAVIRSGSAGNVILVTGAGGQVGSRLSSLLRAAGHRVLAVDIHANALENVESCDIRRDDQVARLFASTSIRTVVHLAAILPTASRADPIIATEVNLTGTLRLLREALTHQVERFVFGSSMSVYGSSGGSRALNEHDRAAPDDPYGAAKRAVELAGESLAVTTGFGFVALRRSEEHTSELQSQSNLVCRLLLEKKKDELSLQSPTY